MVCIGELMLTAIRKDRRCAAGSRTALFVPEIHWAALGMALSPSPAANGMAQSKASCVPTVLPATLTCFLWVLSTKASPQPTLKPSAAEEWTKPFLKAEQPAQFQPIPSHLNPLSVSPSSLLPALPR